MLKSSIYFLSMLHGSFNGGADIESPEDESIKYLPGRENGSATIMIRSHLLQLNDP